MVRKLSKIFGYSIFFVLTLMYFVPKVSLYYLGEQTLEKYGVVIDDEKVIDNGFSLSLYDATVNVKGIPSVEIKEANFKQFIVYNSSTFKDLKLSSVANSMIPTNVDEVSIVYSILNPLYVTANATGGFGEAEVEFNILERSIHLELLASKKMLSSYRNTLRKLKKSKEGVYVYDKSIKY